MKRLFKSLSGVTLLEIMLVLAIAAMVIVMSVRYYQSATAGSQANSAVMQVQAIFAAADSLAQSAGGDYSAAGVSVASLTPMLPGTAFVLPWGSTITMGVPTATSVLLTMPSVPSTQCTLIRNRLSSNNRFSLSACGAGATTITITYSSI